LGARLAGQVTAFRHQFQATSAGGGITMAMLSRFMIIMGMVRVALRVDGQLQGEPWWLFRIISSGAIVVLLGGLHLFAVALKHEILEEMRKVRSSAPSPQ
jgi:hypothetical protein